MPHFGWTRLAYLLFVLVVLTALVQLASLRPDPRPLSSEPSDGVAAAAPRTTDEEPREPAKTTPPAAPLPAALPASVSDRLEDMATDVPTVGSPYTRAPVFRRPAPATPPAGSGGVAVRTPAFGSGPVCGDLENFPSTSKIVFPLPKRYLYSYEDTWGAPRPQGGHEGTDLMAPTPTPEYAITGGTVVQVAGADSRGWNELGGWALMIEAAYDIGPIKKGDLLYYAHRARPGLKPGDEVRAGQKIGEAGDSGYGPPGTIGKMPEHLHLGWYDASGARSALDSGAMNPYPLLEWIKANGGAVGGGSNARYCQAPQTGVPPPSVGESRWPTPDSPGVRPDLDTGSDDPKPSPVVEKSQNRVGHPVDLAKKAEPAKQSGQDTLDGAPAKKPQAPPAEAPKPRPPHPKPPTAETTPAEPPVPPAQEPPPPQGGSPPESPPPDTAAGKKHDPSDGRQEAETGENKKGEAGEQDREERPEKQDQQQGSRPSNEHTSPEEDPPASETAEPETTDETETDDESTMPEPAPETTEATMAE